MSWPRSGSSHPKLINIAPSEAWFSPLAIWSYFQLFPFSGGIWFSTRQSRQTRHCAISFGSHPLAANWLFLYFLRSGFGLVVEGKTRWAMVACLRVCMTLFLLFVCMARGLLGAIDMFSAKCIVPGILSLVCTVFLLLYVAYGLVYFRRVRMHVGPLCSLSHVCNLLGLAFLPSWRPFIGKGKERGGHVGCAKPHPSQGCFQKCHECCIVDSEDRASQTLCNKMQCKVLFRHDHNFLLLFRGRHGRCCGCYCCFGTVCWWIMRDIFIGSIVSRAECCQRHIVIGMSLVQMARSSIAVFYEMTDRAAKSTATTYTLWNTTLPNNKYMFCRSEQVFTMRIESLFILETGWRQMSFWLAYETCGKRQLFLAYRKVSRAISIGSAWYQSCQFYRLFHFEWVVFGNSLECDHESHIENKCRSLVSRSQDSLSESGLVGDTESKSKPTSKMMSWPSIHGKRASRVLVIVVPHLLYYFPDQRPDYVRMKLDALLSCKK